MTARATSTASFPSSPLQMPTFTSNSSLEGLGLLGPTTHGLSHKISSSSLCLSTPPQSPRSILRDRLNDDENDFNIVAPASSSSTSEMIDVFRSSPTTKTSKTSEEDQFVWNKLDNNVSTTPSIRLAKGSGMQSAQSQLFPLDSSFDSRSKLNSRAIDKADQPHQLNTTTRYGSSTTATTTTTTTKLVHPHWSSISSLPSNIFNTANSPIPLVDTTAKTNNGIRRGVSVNDLGMKSRAELERMLEGADQLIRQKEQELSVFSAAGEDLLQEYHSLRSRHDALLSTNNSLPLESEIQPLSPTESSTSRPTSSRTSSGTSGGTPFGWSPRQLALPFGATASPAPRPARPLSRGHFQFPPSPSSPWTPGSPDNFTCSRRRRQSETSSASMLSPSAGSLRGATRSGLTSPMNIRNAQVLSQRNEVLTQQLTELEVDAEKADREGRKKLRKLERELSELRSELGRVESLNENLKAQAEVERAGSMALRQSVRDRKEREATRAQENGLLLPVRPGLQRSSLSDSENEQNKRFEFGSMPPPPIKLNGRSRSGPVHQLSSSLSGSGVLFSDRHTIDVELAKAKKQAQAAEDAQKAQEFIVQKLMDKIGELQETNEIISQERVEIEQRLRDATIEVDEFKQRCEELEEVALLEGIDLQVRREIGWRGDSLGMGDAPPMRMKGNRRMIEKQRRRKAGEWRAMSGIERSVSNQSISSSIGTGDSPTRKPGQSRERSFHRTLGSELGGAFDTSLNFNLDPYDYPPRSEYPQGDEDDEGDCTFVRHYSFGDNDSEDDGEGSSACSHDTSRPQPQQRSQRPSRHSHHDHLDRDEYESPVEDTSKPLFASGSLRWSGYPDETDYDTIDRVTSELPVAWEDEDGSREPTTPHKLGRVKGRLLEWVEGGGESPAEVDRLFNRYPEEDEPTHFAQLESREAVEARTSLAPSSLRHRRRGTLKRKGSNQRARLTSGRLRDVFDADEQSDDGGEYLTKRQMALRRMGLEDTRNEDDDDVYAHDGRSDDSCSSNGDESIMTEYEMLDGRARQGDYYPVSLRARYAPRMVLARVTDTAMQRLVDLVTYIRFFALLAMAVTFALWQGPKRALGEQPKPRRRRIQQR